MDEWKDCKLVEAPLEILDGDRGKNYPSQNEFMASGHCLFLSTKNVRIDGFDFSECQFISKERDELLRKGKLERDDLVLTTRGTVGNLGFYDSSVNYVNVRINSGMVIIRPKKNELFPTFNYYLFRKLQNDFHTFISGSAQPQLPIRDLKEVDVSIPLLPEQKAIASVLSCLDDKIDLLHRQNKILEAMAETLFRQWFVEEAQDDWEPVKIGDFIRTNISSVTKDTKLKTIRYLDTGSMNEGKVDNFQLVDLSDAPSRARRIVRHNDVLIFSNILADNAYLALSAFFIPLSNSFPPESSANRCG
jgi:restriction endonuclease S subunit